MTSLASLKDSILRDQGVEERVEVNQRHLIDKILARYSAENTIFRELLQNSNDAGATEAQIHFKTGEQLIKPTSSFLDLFYKRTNPTVVAVTYKNNGRPFSGDDWNRLRKIAEGNPDEQKIGFFGVGFYSLFSICEEPFVSSGNECLAFFWRGDQLFTKKGKVEEKDSSPWTSFFLGLREPIEAPNVVDFGRFLASSLTFTKSLRKVEVFIDDDRVLCLEKKIGESRPLVFSKSLYNLVSPNRIFELKSISVSKNQLDVHALIDYDKSKGKLGTSSNESVFLRTASGTCSVKLDSHISKEMERTTKKRPPATTDVLIVFSNHDEYESSSGSLSRSQIFSELIISPKEQGRIFIGFPTHQTTGGSFQLAAHLIPTVERESIDFVDRTLTIWNQDILSIGGILSRVVFEDEMSSIGNLYKELSLDAESEGWLVKKATHALSSFSFRTSTPATLVGRIHKSYFFKGGKFPMSVVSTKGILPCTSVRLPDLSAVAFIKEVPTLTTDTMKACEELFRDLEASDLLKKFSLEDVLFELSKRLLDVSEVIALIKWWLEFKKSFAVSNAEIGKLYQLLLLIDPLDTAAAPRKLADLKHFVNPQIIPSNVPIPKSCFPIAISKNFSKSELTHAFSFLSELSLVEWVNFIVTHADFVQSPVFVEQMMATISRQYGSISNQSKEQITAKLREVNCIVTSRGLCRPVDSYLKTVTLFDDLPMVAFENPKHFSDAFLKSLGVRDHVDLQLIFARLQTLKWDSDHVQLVKYLASVHDKLTDIENGRLKLTPIFPKEDDGSPEHLSQVARYKASDLYAPSETLRALGLPLISWPGKTKWRSTSDEAKFLFFLGLKSTIPIDHLVDFCAKFTGSRREMFFKYFVDNYKETYSKTYAPSKVQIPYLPSSNYEEKLFRPIDIYADPSSSILKFPILSADLRQHAEMLGVMPHPSGSALVIALANALPTQSNARDTFSYLSGRQQDFTSADWRKLHTMKFVPVERGKKKDGSSDETWAEPTRVYIGSSQSSRYGDFFTYIDFGDTSNAFLRACGVKDEPSIAEVTFELVQSPLSFLERFGYDKYLNLLRTVATNYEELRQNSNLHRLMKESPFLIALKGSEVDKREKNQSEKDNTGDLQCQLARAQDIFIIDDPVVNQLFTPLGAPMEIILEQMYLGLGSQWLASQITVTTRIEGQPKITLKARELQELIHERALLLLYDGIQTRTMKDIAPNAEKILKSMLVQEVPRVWIERTFLGIKKAERTSCCLHMDKKTKTQYYLFITTQESDVDYFDIAQEIGKIVFKKPRLNDSLLLSTLLSTSLTNLKRKGFPVDRILNLQESKLKEATIRAAAVTAAASAKSSPSTSAQQLEVNPPSMSSPASSPLETNLLTLFPDISREYLRRLLKEYGDKNGALDLISNRLLDEKYPREEKTLVGPSAPPKNLEKKVVASPPGGWPEAGVVPKKSSKSDDDVFSTLKGLADNVRNTWLPDLWSPNRSSNQGSNTINAGPSIGNSSEPAEITPQTTERLKEQLAMGVSAVKESRESTVKGSIPFEPKPPPASYTSSACRVIAENDLILRGTVDELPLYLDRTAGEEGEAVLANTEGLQKFAIVLKALAHVFKLQPAAVNIYFDKAGKTVAFNRGRTLFFNLRYYLGLHFHQGQDDDAETYYFWFMTLCHELAHNFVSEHNSDHEYYFSSFAENYLKDLHLEMKKRGLA